MTEAERRALKICQANIKAPWCTDDYHLKDAVAQALRDYGDARLEEAAKESESWWDLFNSADPVLRRAANPNQIAARIRALKGKP